MRDLGDRTEELRALNQIADAFILLGNFDQALDYSQQALNIAQQLENSFYEKAYSLDHLGSVNSRLGNYAQAIKYYQQSLAIAQNIDNHQLKAQVLNNMGIAFHSQKNYTQAVYNYQQSLALHRNIGDLRGQGSSLNNLGVAFYYADNLSEAEKALKEAVSIWESLRARLGQNDNYKLSIFEEQARTYRFLQKVLIAQNKNDEALEIAERGRARAFVELLSRSITLSDFPQEIIDSPSIEQIRQIAIEQKVTLVEYSIFYEEFESQQGIQAQESELFIWVINPTGEIKFHLTELKNFLEQTNCIYLKELVRQARISIGIEDGKVTDFKPPQRVGKNWLYSHLCQFYQILIEQIAKFLPDEPNATVIFIPQSYLFLIPFPALQDKKGNFLLQKYTILTAPSIQVLKLASLAIKDKLITTIDALVVGNPKMPLLASRIGEEVRQLKPLPASEAEARTIASLLNTQAIIADQATKVDIVRQMPKARLIHLATHGVLDDIKQLGIPGAIALAPKGNDNGFLTAGEIMEMFGSPHKQNLQAELFVLSACVTGLGKITEDGVIGLSRCLMAAGIPRVVVSLWAVSDLSTAFLMIKFYEILKNFVHLESADVAKSLINVSCAATIGTSPFNNSRENPSTISS
jgi:CHAT domain-containing protein